MILLQSTVIVTDEQAWIVLATKSICRRDRAEIKCASSYVAFLSYSR